MTAPYRESRQCPHCGRWYSNETNFMRWFRKEPHLDSVREGIVRLDHDLLLHRYRGPEGRDLQWLMVVEIKTFNASLQAWQADTLHALNQVLRNCRPNIHSKPPKQMSYRPQRAWSLRNKREIRIRLCGAHLLTLSGSSPLDSNEMYWGSPETRQGDHREISLNELILLFRFELDPDKLVKMDTRIHQAREPHLVGL